VPPLARIQEWISRGFDRHVITSIQGASLLRWAQGFLTMFLAFYVERTSHGLDAALALGSVALAAGVGGFLGTVAGARLKLGRPDVMIVGCTSAAALACVIAAAMFSLPLGVFCMAVCAAGNSLGTLSLDAVIQRDVDETLRSSAFARTETFLQLAWVFGAALALLLPARDGRLDMTVAALFLAGCTVVVVLRSRSMAAVSDRARRAARDAAPAPPDGGAPDRSPGTV
jgi:MFS family permease